MRWFEDVFTNTLHYGLRLSPDSESAKFGGGALLSST